MLKLQLQAQLKRQPVPDFNNMAPKDIMPPGKEIDLDPSDADDEDDEGMMVADEQPTSTDFEDVKNASIVLESMNQNLPVSKYTHALHVDIEEAQVECAMILSSNQAASANDPENTTSQTLGQKIKKVMSSFSDIKEMYESIMKPRTSMKRTASDPPEPKDTGDFEESHAPI